MLKLILFCLIFGSFAKIINEKKQLIVGRKIKSIHNFSFVKLNKKQSWWQSDFPWLGIGIRFFFVYRFVSMWLDYYSIQKGQWMIV